MLPPTKVLAWEFRYIDQLITMGNYKEAFQLVEMFGPRNDLPPTDHLIYQLIKSRLMMGLSSIEEGLQRAEAAFHESQRQQNHILAVDALTVMAEALFWLGRFDEGLKTIKHGEYELGILVHDQPAEVLAQRKSRLLHWKSLIYLWKGEWEQALESAQQSLTLVEQLGNSLDIAWTHWLHGTIYRDKGDLEQTFTSFEKSLALAKEYDDNKCIAWALSGVGIVYRVRGDLDQALEYCTQSLTLAEKLGDEKGVATFLVNLSQIHRLKGNLQQALEYSEQSLTLCEKLGLILLKALVPGIIGRIYIQKGDWEHAGAYLEQSLARLEEISYSFWIASTLYYLVSVAVNKNSLDQARQYLHHLQQLNEQGDSRIISQWSRIAEALILKTSPRRRHQGRAEELLEQVTTEEVVTDGLTVLALLHLCDLLLTELRTSNDPELLREVRAHVHQLQKIATQQPSYWVLAETYVLQSKLALVDLNLEDSRCFLTQARQLAEEHGLHPLTMQISSEYETLLDQLSQWEDLIDRKVSVVERMELANLEAQVVRMIHRRVKEIPDNLLKLSTKSHPINEAAISTKTQPQSLTDRILRNHPCLEYDDISNSIIRCLENKNYLNISQLTKEVRKQRGRASRRVIRERVNRLITQGILEEVDVGSGRQVRIILLSDG